MSSVTDFPVVYLGIFALARITLSTPTPPQGGSERIHNGTEIDPPNKYPFLAAIYNDDCFNNGECRPGTGGVTCGASVGSCDDPVLVGVNKHWVVTAAHCCHFDNDSDVERLQFIVTGLHNQSAFSPWSQNLSISHCIVHHLYNENDITNDIALIRVKGTIIFNDKVAPMNLPALGFDVKEDGEIKAQAMGWGLLANHESPMVPNEVALLLVTLDTCQRTYGYFEARTGPKTNNESLPVLETNVCAGYGVPRESACYGDSGSPLVTYNSDKATYTQVGLASWVEFCGIKGHYTVFSNVAKYIVWINSVIRSCPERVINKAES